MTEFINRESGGCTKIVLVTRVHKEATDERMDKLADEIRFLKEIPEKWRVHFPQIVLSQIGDKKTFYEMPDYGLPTLRRLLFSGTFGHKEALRWIDKILAFAFEMYREEVLPMPTDYMDFMHFGRVRRRLNELCRRAPLFKEVILIDALTVNGAAYLNVPRILTEIEHSDVLPECLPEFVSRYGHSDLHFSNVLIDLENDNFILIDPRGYPYCDYYYDFGKLWHSVNGKYEFVAENRFTLDRSCFELERNEVFFECEKIKAGLPTILAKHSKEPIDTIMLKTEFNEAMHFASLVPFILDYDGKERRALVGYYTAVILLNKFLEKHES